MRELAVSKSWEKRAPSLGDVYVTKEDVSSDNELLRELLETFPTSEKTFS